jgi:DNA-binding LytR/AlgR family response regulator
MNVVVIEDERLTAQRLVTLLQKYDPSIVVLAQISSVADALSWFRSYTASPIDLIFLDIHLEDGDGFQIINELQLSTPVIFTTAFDDYMVKAFKVNSIDYLLKPLNYDELAAALTKFRTLRTRDHVQSASMQVDIEKLMRHIIQENNPKFKERFMIGVGTKIRSIQTTDIAFFYLEEKTVLAVTDDGRTHPMDYSLDKLTQIIDPEKFFRISRQFIVSLRAIEMVHTLSSGKLKLDVVPKTKEEVTVSGDRTAAFKEWLGKD